MTQKSVDRLHAELVETQESIDAGEEKKEQLLKDLQGVCHHPLVAEYQPADHGEPRRICCICLIEDTGWGCGWETLRDGNSVKAKVSLDELVKLRKPKRLIEVQLPAVLA